MANDAKQEKPDLDQAARALRDSGAVQRLLRSEDTRRMVDLLGSQDQVKGAARAAAAGDPAQLMEMMRRLMSTPEGARLVERVAEQAEQSGL